MMLEKTIDGPVSYFRSAGKFLDGISVKPESEISTEKKLKMDIFCKLCLAKITSHSEEIFIDGNFSFDFTNPVNLSFTLGCFANAPGCIIEGIPTDEATWFSGYEWSFVKCRNCSEHLGWYYQNKDDGFFGLILTKLDGDI